MWITIIYSYIFAEAVCEILSMFAIVQQSLYIYYCCGSFVLVSSIFKKTVPEIS